MGGSKSAKSTKSKSSKLKKSSNNIKIRKKGSTSFLEPAVDNILSYNVADYVSTSSEEAIVECTRLCNEDCNDCNEEDGRCTTFEVLERGPNDVPRFRCTLMNNNMNEFNQKTIYPTSELSLIKRN